MANVRAGNPKLALTIPSAPNIFVRHVSIEVSSEDKNKLKLPSALASVFMIVIMGINTE